ncbi:MAG TPA: MBOAT family O-acyltransferase [Acidobacteriaceae bacterium]|nr:MBOAT family O-acyltransferase [Acidobacteriaceae bacterium]
MLFNSFVYIASFLPATVLLCVFLRRAFGPLAAQLCILAASLLFYAWGKPSNLIFLAASILANWAVANFMRRAPQHVRGYWLRLGIILNVAFLCSFKYFNFFLGVIPYFGSHHVLPNLAFPLGISFFTLAQIMYLVDCSDELVPALNLLDHATFVSFFPYVISGPIAKAKRMVGQFGNFGHPPGDYYELLSRGLYLFAMGAFKKTVFAFCFGAIADSGFNVTGRLSGIEAWTYSLAFTLQIYFDFSGYTDMARGSAMMLGIEIPRNFDAPLRSKSIIEFWERWHITLSNFITSYMYTPILKSFSRITLRTAAVATILAMTIAGLWHGPNWTFIVFGALHGVALAINQYWRKKKLPKLHWALSWGLTLVFVDIAFIFFRSNTIPDAANFINALFNYHQPLALEHLAMTRRSFSMTTFGVPLLLGVIVAFYGRGSDQIARELKPGYRDALSVAGIFLVALIFMNSHISQSFIYFRF